MNKWIGTGRFTADPETRYTQGQTQMAVSRFTLAVDRRGAKKEGAQTADFINCVAFDKTAEFIQKYFRKGNKALVTGRIQTGSYTNKNGDKVYTTDIAVEDIEFGESKKAEEEKPAPPKGYGDVVPKQESFMNIPDNIGDDLPFN